MFFRLFIGCCILVCGVAEAAPLLQQGSTTYYHPNGNGACSFEDSVDYNVSAAMNLADYDHSAMCGAYLRIIGPKGEAVVRVVDSCRGCKPNGLDLSQQAFEQVADLKQGREIIAWHIISPALNTPVQYHFKAGSNAYWTAIQVRNHRNPISKLEYLTADGTWTTMERGNYNYFVQKKPGMGNGPYTLRITDVYGNTLIDKEIPLSPGESVSGDKQLPFVNSPQGPLATPTPAPVRPAPSETRRVALKSPTTPPHSAVPAPAQTEEDAEVSLDELALRYFLQ
jgi:expansin (peptidoglycan-binding protein)